MSYTVSDYIIDRLSALGTKHLFTVPGNYCAEFLIAAQKSNKIDCIGTTNEMEAGYAADAYSRLRGIGVVCVTYGVGTGSLLNAIEGAFVEFCPVVLINGSAKAEKAQQLVRQGVLFAHAIDTIRTDEAIFRPVTAATAVITDPKDAPREIDRVLRTCVAEKRPVYLEVRDGVWLQPCEKPTDSDVPIKPLPLPPEVEADINKAVNIAVSDVLQRLQQAKNPVLWGGEGLQRFGLHEQFSKLVRLTGLPYTTTMLGKSVVSEEELKDYFIGVYDSVFAPANVKNVVEGADCLIALGTILCDFYGPIVAKSFDKMILAAGGAIRIGSYVYPNVPLDRFVNRLIEVLEQQQQTEMKQTYTPPPGFDRVKELRIARWSKTDKAMKVSGVSTPAESENKSITWDSFFEQMHGFIDKDMTILADTGLCLFPSAELQIEQRSHFIAQTAWLSIGFMVGAAVGASMAIPENERVVVLTGDGGFQMIAQAFSTLVRHKKPALMFVFNNRIYGIEQYLVDKTYYQNLQNSPIFFNELAEWDYVKLAEAFGGRGFLVNTEKEMSQTLIASKELIDKPTLISVRLDPRDLPAEIKETVDVAMDTTNFSPGATEVSGKIAPSGFN
jgi:indolepyruvate decarboxylase